MPHTKREKKKLIHRIRRLRGQVEAVERALDEDRECFAILQLLSACRGAMNGLMAELMEGHAISSRLRLNPEYFPDVLEHLE